MAKIGSQRLFTSPSDLAFGIVAKTMKKLHSSSARGAVLVEEYWNILMPKLPLALAACGAVSEVVIDYKCKIWVKII